ncbi:MAG: hypothetical protein FJX56_06745, partial [Alphaproteobacteria bacterium]|nr:hypothetical protein [Alphaproteobacteria bacterium]
MTALSLRLERALKTTGTRSLGLRLAFKRAFLRRARCVFVTAMPKSASSLLAAELAEATGFLRYFLGQNPLGEQDLYLPRLIDSWTMDIVCHQHVRAKAVNLALMREFAIRPIILVRDIGDALVSLRDHLKREGPVTPVFEAPPGFAARERSWQLDALIDLAAPWYVDFYAGWCSAAIEKLWLKYPDVVAPEGAALARALAFHGVVRQPAELTAARRRAQGAEVRFNKGIAGRG